MNAILGGHNKGRWSWWGRERRCYHSFASTGFASSNGEGDSRIARISKEIWVEHKILLECRYAKRRKLHTAEMEGYDSFKEGKRRKEVA
mmetsp:Transcript_27747/g.32020  ORF Transcript_27747/g.32020 Transcript_27747/m.32020 type:complete len:89 (+) Transcript_27747:39-305(+)